MRLLRVGSTFCDKAAQKQQPQSKLLRLLTEDREGGEVSGVTLDSEFFLAPYLCNERYPDSKAVEGSQR